MSSQTPTPTPAPTTPLTTPQDTQDQSSTPFKPTTVVLAKVKGYPPWPAMVLEESILPQNIIDKKPKNVKQQSKKKNAKLIEILPVRFFSDDTYIWIKDQDLKILDNELIEKYLSNDKKRRKDNLLNEAYKLANNPPDMELFVKYGSIGKPIEEEIIEEQQYSEEEGEEEEEEEDDVAEEEEEEERDEYGEPPLKQQKTSKKSKKIPAKSSKKAAKKETKKSAKAATGTKSSKAVKKPEPKEEGYDSDWGLDELTYNYEQGNYIFDDEKEQEKFNNTFPDISTIQGQYNKYQSQFNKLNDEMSSQLLAEDDLNESEILENLDKLKTLDNIPKSIILKSNLFKILILTIRKPIEQFPNTRIKQEISKTLKDWFNLFVTTNTLEDLKRIDDELNNKDSQSHSQEPEVKVAKEEDIKENGK